MEFFSFFGGTAGGVTVATGTSGTAGGIYQNASSTSVFLTTTAVAIGNVFQVVPTPEEIEKAHAEMRRTRLAGLRARRLFVRVAGRAASSKLRRDGHLDVIGASGQRYRLALGSMVRVMRAHGDEVLHTLCVHPGGCPAYDVLTAQLLMLTASPATEAMLLKRANVYRAVA